MLIRLFFSLFYTLNKDYFMLVAQFVAKIHHNVRTIKNSLHKNSNSDSHNMRQFPCKT